MSDDIKHGIIYPCRHSVVFNDLHIGFWHDVCYWSTVRCARTSMSLTDGILDNNEYKVFVPFLFWNSIMVTGEKKTRRDNSVPNNDSMGFSYCCAHTDIYIIYVHIYKHRAPKYNRDTL